VVEERGLKISRKKLEYMVDGKDEGISNFSLINEREGAQFQIPLLKYEI
jgi:hypothetical protein